MLFPPFNRRSFVLLFVASFLKRALNSLCLVQFASQSHSPKVFHVHNFLSMKEADQLIAKAKAKSNPYSIRPSTTGHKSWTQGGESETATTRTSENGFDVDSPTAVKVKQRAFDLLRIPYLESMADGIQILRYKPKQAYIGHHDYFPTQQSSDFNWDPQNGGSNRFATVLLYLSDVSDGGGTVFTLKSNASAIALNGADLCSHFALFCSYFAPLLPHLTSPLLRLDSFPSIVP